MEENLYLDYDAFLRSIKRNIDVPHSFLLGAGASISSGIQSAYDCIWEWKRDIYISKNLNAAEYYKNHRNEGVRQSIQKWLDNHGGFPDLDTNEEYSFYAEKAYPIAEDRRKYFLSLIEGKNPYIGYKLLCFLAGQGIVKSVWTTNFDGLMVRAGHQNNLIPIEITLDNADRIFRNQSTKELLCIALHGDYKYTTLKNTDKELDSQDEIFKEHLGNYHTDKNLIVAGYSGRDVSLMNALKSAFSKRGTGRLYWCGYGDNINKEVEDLIWHARASGREAYYISTDGFDKTLIHLSKTIFEDNKSISDQIQQVLETSDEEETVNTDFKLDFSKTDKYIKSNLHPIVFPKEVFQFQVDYGHNRPWAFLRELTENTTISAVPFKGKVFALGSLSEISSVFRPYLQSKVVREQISNHDIANVTAFKNLMLMAVAKHFCASREVRSNFKDRIWLKDAKNQIGDASVHDALYLSLYFDKKYAYLALAPTIHLESATEVSKTMKQQVSKGILEKLYNDKYDNELHFWNGVLFGHKKLIFEYPTKSGTGFEFQISANTAYGEIDVLDSKYRSYTPQNYNGKQTQFRGVQFLEPQLIFKNTSSNNDFRDFHPMRGLINNRPYDVNLNGIINSNEINLSVICGSKYAQRFFSFLSGLNSKHPTQGINTDYLIDYPGFFAAYNIPINIPIAQDSSSWMDINFVGDNSKQTHENAVALAQMIKDRIQKISAIQGSSSVVIFIPEEWQPFESYINDTESFDLHDNIKAFAASIGMSTQLIREDTLEDKLKCQIYWWLSLSFYVKSLRTPWILNSQERKTAYAGIGYSVSKIKDKQEIVIGCSHIYDSNGQGLKYRLSKIDNYVLDKQNNPYLSYKDAFQFGVSIRELFYQSLDALPERVVIHKRTKFTPDEIDGIRVSLNQAGIKKIDLIEINYDIDAKFVAMSVYQNNLQVDRFPISRGTCIVTNKKTALLWTHGIVPSVKQQNYKFYLGGRSIPAPIKITKHYGESNIDLIATEILGLTKMNWNSLDLYSKLPSTIDSSNQIARIGKLLARYEGRSYDYRLFI